MIPRAALAFLVALAFAAPARAAGELPAYDAKAAPLDDLSREMLTGNGYEIRDDGKVWDKIGEAPVSQNDMPYMLSRLASAKRLRALLQINNIITRYDAERKLTPEDREAVRVLVRQNWIVFGIAPRNDFRAYFSVEELDALDKIPPRFESMSPLSMIDPAPESVTSEPPARTAAPSVTALPPAAPPSVAALPPAAVAVSSSVNSTPPAAAAVVAAPAVAVAPAPVPVPLPTPVPPVAPQAAVVAAPAAAAVAAVPAKVIPILSPMMELPSLKRASPFAPAAAPAVAAVAPAASAVPAAPPPTYKVEPAAPPPAPAPLVAAPIAPSTSAVVAADLGTLKPWTPPARSTAAAPSEPAAVAVSTPAAPPVAVVAPPPAPEPPKALTIDAAEYEKFVAEGPYTKEGKAFLQLIGKRAPDYCLPLLRRTVVGAVPQIVMDGARTGLELRAGFTRDAANPLAPPIVALSPGPVFVEVKRGLFGAKAAVLLPESPSAWSALGVARPALDALRADASGGAAENGEWGASRAYADGSRRGSFSSTEQAGELLEQLLLIGLSREGLDASPYAARRWARTARLMFSQRFKEELQQDAFLDPDRRAELRDWLDHPDEADDMTAAIWSGSRSGLLDPRRGPPEAARDVETRARNSCGRSALEDSLAESSRRRASAVGALEALVDAGVVDAAAAKAAAQGATEAEGAARVRLLASPPACAPADPARDEGLRKAALLLAESARAERLMREHKAGIESHAL